MADTPDTLPTFDELAQMPRRAIVAYAVRCARRVQPLYAVARAEDAPVDEIVSFCRRIHDAITVAERWARNESVGPEILHAATDTAETARHAAAATNTRYAAASAGSAVAAGRTAFIDFYVNAAIEAADAAAYAAADFDDSADAKYATSGLESLRSTVDSAYVANTAARRDFEILKAHRFKPDAPVDASESGPCGELWIDEPPDWYPQGQEQLRKLGVLKKLSRRKTSPPAANTEELQNLRAEQERLQRERKSLESNLETARAETARYHEELDRARASLSNQEANRLQELTTLGLAQQRAAQLEVELRKTQSDLLHTNTQLEIALIGQSEAKEELELRQPQSLGWYGRMFFRAENILNSITVVVLCAIVGFALIGIGEVYERQALDRWVKARSDEFQDRAIRADVDTRNELTNRNFFDAFHSRIMILSIAGATSPDDTIVGLREQLRKVQVEMAGETFPPQPAQGPLSWWRSLISWPQYWSSDLLLSLVVLFSATIGAVITTMRRNDRLSLRDLGLGVSAGFITFLIVRGGKSVFLVDADPLLLINPYNSAFFGMLAGMFTELTFGLLGLFAKEFSERLKRVVKLVFSEPLPSDEKRPKPDTPPDPEKQNKP